MRESLDTMEKAIIGALVDSRDVPALLDELGDLAAGHFDSPKCEAAFEVIQRMAATPGAKIDAATVDAHIREIPDFETRGVDFLFFMECLDSRHLLALAPTYAQMVVAESTKRNLGLAGANIAAKAREGMGADELMDYAQQQVDAAKQVTSTPLMSSADAMASTIQELRNPVKGILTPWADVNELLGGLVGGRLYVVGARPSVGKSVIALQLALALSKHGYVSFSSLEMGANEINTRILAHDHRINMGSLQGKPDAYPLTEAQWATIDQHARSYAHNTLLVNDDSSATFSSVRKHARAAHRKGNLTGIVLDYLQLLSAERGDRRPRHEVVAEWSRNLKNLARELDVPVIALSQLNRDSTQGGADGQEPMPKISQLRESGAVEQDADVVMLLHRQLIGPETGNLKMLIGKNRQGRTGVVDLDFYGHYSEARSTR